MHNRERKPFNGRAFVALTTAISGIAFLGRLGRIRKAVPAPSAQRRPALRADAQAVG